MIKLSIIIPVYNCEKYIKRCISKILEEQIDNIILNYNNVEIIIVNDGSTDNTSNIINEFAYKYPLINIITKSNEGVSIARNVGIKHAKGKYIYFIDADDYLDKECLPELIKISEKFDCDVTSFQYRFVTENNNNFSQSPIPKYQRPIDGIEFIQQTHGLTWRWSSCIYIYNRNFIIKNKIIFNDKIYRFEDCIFVWNVFIKAKSVVVVNNLYYNYVQNSMSCMHNKDYNHKRKLLSSTIPFCIELSQHKQMNNPDINIHIDKIIANLILGHIIDRLKIGDSFKIIHNDINTFKSLKLYPIYDFTNHVGFDNYSFKFKRIFVNHKYLVLGYSLLTKILNYIRIK